MQQMYDRAPVINGGQSRVGLPKLCEVGIHNAGTARKCCLGDHERMLRVSRGRGLDLGSGVKASVRWSGCGEPMRLVF